MDVKVIKSAVITLTAEDVERFDQQMELLIDENIVEEGSILYDLYYKL